MGGGRHIDNECMRSQGRIQDFPKGGAAYHTMIHIFVCVRVRHSAWEVEHGGGGGGGRAARGRHFI